MTKLCERCGGEGQLYTSRYGGNDPDVWPVGECPVCEGTGMETVEVEPVEEEEGMTEIVVRLRRLTKQGEDYIWRPATDAIAEIERLRDALREIRDDKTASYGVSNIARSALPVVDSSTVEEKPR
jgi:DnaJ-class molecular chaperone